MTPSCLEKVDIRYNMVLVCMLRKVELGARTWMWFNWEVIPGGSTMRQKEETPTRGCSGEGAVACGARFHKDCLRGIPNVLELPWPAPSCRRLPFTPTFGSRAGEGAGAERQGKPGVRWAGGTCCQAPPWAAAAVMPRGWHLEVLSIGRASTQLPR